MWLLQMIIFFLVIRPLIMVIIGLNLRNAERLPTEGPAVVAANHNSHLDTLTLMSLWPLSKLYQVRPVAAADYFLSNPILAWFSLNIMRIIPIDRKRTDKSSDPFVEMSAALARGETLILFPEGSRGEPEELSRFKTGMARLIEVNPDVPIIPIFTHGLGKALPRGDFLLVPFFADLAIGHPIYWRGSVEETMARYQDTMAELAEELEVPAWE